jgi:hypothetical protein
MINSTQLINMNMTMNDTKEGYFYGIYSTPLHFSGVFTNLINAIIFSNKKFKDKTFTYLLYHSISEFFYLLLVGLSEIPYCGHYCSYLFKVSLLSQLVSLYIDTYFTSCLAIFALFIELTISFQRYLVVSNSTFCGLIKNGSAHKISIVLFIISIFYYLPDLICYSVKRSTMSPDVYELVRINYKIQSYFSYLAVIIRGPICTLLLTIINFLTLVKFRKQMKKKAVIRFGNTNLKSNTFLIFYY